MKSRRAYILLWTLQALALLTVSLLVLNDLRRASHKQEHAIGQRLVAFYLAEGSVLETTKTPTEETSFSTSELGTLYTDLQRLHAGSIFIPFPKMEINRRTSSWAGVKILECDVCWFERQHYRKTTYRMPVVEAVP